MRKLGYLMAAVALLLAANATNAMASPITVAPEISPASLSGGIGLLVSGALLLRARFGK